MKEPLRILVVDDNRDMADSLAAVLELGGHEVNTAYTGVAALKAFEERLSDIVLLDIAMRDMNGFMVAKKIREMEAVRQPKIITISGYPIAEIELRKDLKITRHFIKPIDLAALIACVTQRDY